MQAVVTVPLMISFYSLCKDSYWFFLMMDLILCAHAEAEPSFCYSGVCFRSHCVPHAFQTFQQMELLKFEGETLMDDGGIVRRIKVKGDGFLNPNDGAWVNGKSSWLLPGSIFNLV